MNHEPQASGFRLKIEFAQASDPGRDPNKQVNEDSCGYAETRFGHLAVLCDGMGGHYGGKEASRCAITTIFEMFEQMPPGIAPAAALKSSIEEAGRRVYLLGGPPENRTRPGSTVVAMLMHDRGLDVAHVGDSRAYIIRSGQIYPLTRDHSMVQGMIDAGMLTEETAMGHPDSNKITRALGMKPDVEVELRPEAMELFAGDVLLQSSDGLTDLALGRDILGATRQALASGSVEHACTMLVKMANDRGGHDNITVQMVRVSDVASKVVTTIPERGGYDGGSSRQGSASERPRAPTPPVTAPDGMPALSMGAPPQNQGHAHAQPMPAQQAAPQSGMAWAPVMPTAPDATPPPAGISFGAPSGPQAPYAPTLAEAPPSMPWGSAQHQPAGRDGGARPQASGSPQGPVSASPGQGLAAYRIDQGQGVGGLPLPPPSRTYGQGTPLPGPAAVPVTAAGGFTPPPGGFAPPTAAMGGGAPMAAPYGMPAATTSRGGIVFIIIGLSAVIAVLILVVVWALWLR